MTSIVYHQITHISLSYAQLSDALTGSMINIVWLISRSNVNSLGVSSAVSLRVDYDDGRRALFDFRRDKG